MNFAFFFTNIMLGVGLAMDAFSVSLANGLNEPCMKHRKQFAIAGTFAFFQALMPLLGYWLGVNFQSFVESVDHWIAFVLLGLIGLNMIKESREGDEESASDSIAFKEMVVLAIATSIDALAVGITFAFLQVNIVPAVSFIGICTFVLSMIGVKIGNVFGVRFKSKAELAGGVILILMGCKILLEHLGILAL